MMNNTNHQCPRCKKQYDCYLRDEHNECPLAYFEPCLNCKLSSLVDHPHMNTREHPEREETK